MLKSRLSEQTDKLFGVRYDAMTVRQMTMPVVLTWLVSLDGHRHTDSRGYTQLQKLQHQRGKRESVCCV
jgi:hypothetical protein